MSNWSCFALGALLLATPHLARAESGDVAQAEKLFRDGAAALKRGDLPAACEALALSETLDPAVGTLGLLALCHERQGRIATAVAEYRTVVTLAREANQSERAAIAARRVEELEPRVSHLQLVLPASRPESLSVEIAGRTLSDSELRLPYPLDPGPTLVKISAPGREPHVETVDIGEAPSTVRWVVPELQAARTATVDNPDHDERRPTVEALPAPEAAPQQSARSTRPTAAASRPISAWTWTAFGSGAASLALGSYFGLSALASHDKSKPHCSGNDCDATGVELRQQALHQATASTALLALGAAALGTSLYLYLDRDPQAPKLAADARAIPNGGMVSLRGRF